jgi:CubicO group peptidase (beta-lactamase class C family)
MRTPQPIQGIPSRGFVYLRYALWAVALVSTGCASNSGDAIQKDVSSSPEPSFGPNAFTAFDRILFDGSAKTEGAVVMVDGKVVYERYAAGYDASKRHLNYSVSKSVGSALLGIAVRDKLVALDASLCTYLKVPEGASPSLCTTKVADLVHMTSGLAWNENYDNPNTSNVLPMLYGDEADMGMYAAMRARAAVADTVWNYSSGESNILARVLRAALGSQNMRAWANEKLFIPAGLKSVVFEADRSGTLMFSSGVFMTPRDMARFGQLYLDGGKLDGVQVLPEAWVTFSQQPASPVSIPRKKTSDALAERGGSYGASFWLNSATAEAPLDTLLYPTAPRDTYCAQGQWGQRICIVPSSKMVVVRVGNDRSGFYNIGPALAVAAEAVASKGSK